MANTVSGFPRFEGESDHDYYDRLDAALNGDAIDEEPERDELDAIDGEAYLNDVWDWNDNDDFLDDLISA